MVPGTGDAALRENLGSGIETNRQHRALQKLLPSYVLGDH